MMAFPAVILHASKALLAARNYGKRCHLRAHLARGLIRQQQVMFDQQMLRQQIQEYNTAITNSVQRHHVILVDLTQQGYNLQNHPEYISDDGLHLTDTGYQQLAKLFYDALKMT